MFQGSQVNPAYGLTWWLPRSTPAVDIVTWSTDITSHAAELPADMVVAAGAGDQRLYIIPSLRLPIVRQAKLDIAALAAGKKGDWYCWGSEESRVGKEGVSTCKSRGGPCL